MGLIFDAFKGFPENKHIYVFAHYEKSNDNDGQVTYKSTRFYDKDKNPWKGKPVSDDTYSIPIVTEFTMNVDPIHVCRSY